MPNMFGEQKFTRNAGQGFTYNKAMARIYMTPAEGAKATAVYALEIPHEEIMDLVTQLTMAHEHGLSREEKERRGFDV